MIAHKALVLLPKHLGDITVFSGIFPSKIKFNHSVLGSDEGDYGTPMFKTQYL